jgi:hypothetical protein
MQQASDKSSESSLWKRQWGSAGRFCLRSKQWMAVLFPTDRFRFREHSHDRNVARRPGSWVSAKKSRNHLWDLSWRPGKLLWVIVLFSGLQAVVEMTFHFNIEHLSSTFHFRARRMDQNPWSGNQFCNEDLYWENSDQNLSSVCPQKETFFIIDINGFRWRPFMRSCNSRWDKLVFPSEKLFSNNACHG